MAAQTKQNIAITGAAGFLGTLALKYLGQRGHQIYVYSGDIRDLGALAQFAADCPTGCALLNFAGLSFVPDCERDPAVAHEVNCTAAAGLFDAMRAKLGHFVFLSTAQVYKPAAAGPISEQGLIAPINEYARSKMAGENAVKICSEKSGVPLTVLRLFNFIHKTQSYPALVPKVYRALCEMQKLDSSERRLTVGNLDLIRDISPVQDFLSALVCLVENPGKESQVANLASGVGKNLRLTLSILFDRMGIQPELVVDPKLLREEPLSIVGDSTLFQRKYGWKPTGIDEQKLIDGFLADL